MITRKDIMEYAVHKFSAFASDLGWKAGQFPQSVATDAGNGHPFVFSHYEESDGDVVAVNYVQLLGCIALRVFND